MAKIVDIKLDANFNMVSPPYNTMTTYTGVVLALDDGRKVKFGIADHQNCCERWDYLHSSDEATDFIGAEYLGLVEKDMWPDRIDKVEMYEDDNFQAIEVLTSSGVLQFVVYNDHNGYYSHATIVVEGDKITRSSL